MLLFSGRVHCFMTAIQKFFISSGLQGNSIEESSEKNAQESIRVKAGPVTPLLQADALAKLGIPI